MAMTNNLLEGQASEWALLRRHPSESAFGIQVACSHPDNMSRLARLLENETSSSFVDLNCGCPIDVVCNRGCGSALMNNPKRLCGIAEAMIRHLPSRQVCIYLFSIHIHTYVCVCSNIYTYAKVTIKIRTGWNDKNPNAHIIVPQLQQIAKGRIAAVFVSTYTYLYSYIYCMY